MNVVFDLTIRFVEDSILYSWVAIITSIVVVPSLLAESRPDETIQAHYQREQRLKHLGRAQPPSYKPTEVTKQELDSELAP